MSEKVRYKADSADIVMALTSMTLSVWLGGWVLATLWTWFMVPLGVTAITWLHASGLNVLVRLFQHGQDTAVYSEREFSEEYIARPLIRPLAAFCVGAIVYGLM